MCRLINPNDRSLNSIIAILFTLNATNYNITSIWVYLAAILTIIKAWECLRTNLHSPVSSPSHHHLFLHRPSSRLFLVVLFVVWTRLLRTLLVWILVPRCSCWQPSLYLYSSSFIFIRSKCFQSWSSASLCNTRINTFFHHLGSIRHRSINEQPSIHMRISTS